MIHTRIRHDARSTPVHDARVNVYRPLRADERLPVQTHRLVTDSVRTSTDQPQDVDDTAAKPSRRHHSRKTDRQVLSDVVWW